MWGEKKMGWNDFELKWFWLKRFGLKVVWDEIIENIIGISQICSGISVIKACSIWLASFDPSGFQISANQEAPITIGGLLSSVECSFFPDIENLAGKSSAPRERSFECLLVNWKYFISRRFWFSKIFIT